MQEAGFIIEPNPQTPSATPAAQGGAQQAPMATDLGTRHLFGASSPAVIVTAKTSAASDGSARSHTPKIRSAYIVISAVASTALFVGLLLTARIVWRCMRSKVCSRTADSGGATLPPPALRKGDAWTVGGTGETKVSGYNQQVSHRQPLPRHEDSTGATAAVGLDAWTPSTLDFVLNPYARRVGFSRPGRGAETRLQRLQRNRADNDSA